MATLFMIPRSGNNNSGASAVTGMGIASVIQQQTIRTAYRDFPASLRIPNKWMDGAPET